MLHREEGQDPFADVHEENTEDEEVNEMWLMFLSIENS